MGVEFVEMGQNLTCSIEELEIKRKQHKKLLELVQTLKERGIVIDFASHPLFLRKSAKNAVEIYQKGEKNIKKGS